MFKILLQKNVDELIIILVNFNEINRGQLFIEQQSKIVPHSKSEVKNTKVI